MAVTDRSLHWNGSTGEQKSAGVSYVAYYLVHTNSASDQTKVILDYFLANGPWIGDSYSFANDSDTSAFCNSIQPRKPNDADMTWVVEVKYESLSEDEEKPDSNGQPTTNPLEWRNDYSISKTSIQVPVWQAKYLGIFTATGVQVGNPDGWVVGDIMLPSNTCGEPLNPPLEKPEPVRVIRISEIMSLYPTPVSDQLYNTVNDIDYDIPLPFTQGGAIKVKKYAGLISDFGGRFFFQNGFFWEVQLEIQQKLNDDWVDKVPNIGLCAGVQYGSAMGIYAGPGNTAAAWPSGAEARHGAAGIPAKRVVKDAFGERFAEPILLDQLNNPIETNNPKDARYIHYMKYETDNHSALFNDNGGPFQMR